MRVQGCQKVFQAFFLMGLGKCSPSDGHRHRYRWASWGYGVGPCHQSTPGQRDLPDHHPLLSSFKLDIQRLGAMPSASTRHAQSHHRLLHDVNYVQAAATEGAATEDAATGMHQKYFA